MGAVSGGLEMTKVGGKGNLGKWGTWGNGGAGGPVASPWGSPGCLWLVLWGTTIATTTASLILEITGTGVCVGSFRSSSQRLTAQGIGLGSTLAVGSKFSIRLAVLSSHPMSLLCIPQTTPPCSHLQG